MKRAGLSVDTCQLKCEKALTEGSGGHNWTFNARVNERVQHGEEKLGFMETTVEIYSDFTALAACW